MPEINDTERQLGEFWKAVKNWEQSERDASPRLSLQSAVADLVGNADISDRVYVAKLTQAGMRNQVWQGRSLSEPNEIMLFLDQTDSSEGVMAAVKGRLHPRNDSGFESVVVARSLGKNDEWQVHRVVEYHKSSLGERLTQQLGEQLSVLKVEDPASGGYSVSSGLSHGTDVDAPGTDSSVDHVSSTVENTYSAAEVRTHLEEALNVMLEGPPGTGKTHLAFEVAKCFADDDPDIQKYRLERILDGRAPEEKIEAIRGAPIVWEIVQLHPSFGYDEFVRGLRTDPDKPGFSISSVDGILNLMAKIARLRDGRVTLLILDEVNRANLSAMLGETIFAIDPGHRGHPVRLQYSSPPGGEDALSVPMNLFILATMNTADRSIATLDFAVRRRFRFLRLEPSQTALSNFYAGHQSRAAKATALMERFQRAVGDPRLWVGHSYFMVPDHATFDDNEWARRLAARVSHDIRPLLEEYKEEGTALVPVTLSDSPHSIDLLSSSTDELTNGLCAWLCDYGMPK
jgi:5-methylcytosine-specific restriction protein B